MSRDKQWLPDCLGHILDLEIVWKTVQKDLSSLYAQVNQALEALQTS